MSLWRCFEDLILIRTFFYLAFRMYTLHFIHRGTIWKSFVNDFWLLCAMLQTHTLSVWTLDPMGATHSVSGHWTLWEHPFLLPHQQSINKGFSFFQASFADNNTDVRLIGDELFQGVKVSSPCGEQGAYRLLVSCRSWQILWDVL